VQIIYSEEALIDLPRLPPQFAEQILRKISRLEHGLIGDNQLLQKSRGRTRSTKRPPARYAAERRARKFSSAPNA